MRIIFPYPHPYSRRVFYYETDQMGIVHHANYIRWLEEARTDYMRQWGIDYRIIEADGILMPVIRVGCEYHLPAKYDDLLEITVKLVKFNGVRAAYDYVIAAPERQERLATGHSEHCFIDAAQRKPRNLRRVMPKYHNSMLRLLNAEENR